MGLDLRVMHVKPNGVNRVWDVKLLDERQNARLHLNLEGTEFLDLVIMGGSHNHGKNIRATRDVAKVMKTRQRRARRKKRKAQG